jgi:hypothetical protein
MQFKIVISFSYEERLDDFSGKRPPQGQVITTFHQNYNA